MQPLSPYKALDSLRRMSEAWMKEAAGAKTRAIRGRASKGCYCRRHRSAGLGSGHNRGNGGGGWRACLWPDRAVGQEAWLRCAT